MAQSQRIKQLPRQVYDLIAAGEVVTSPLSAAKELVENAVDAGASRIWAEIEEGGIALIRVSDDGTGIEPKDLPLAFAPHATSKINDADDLGRIATLGFRGEALASIAAVAEVEMVTKTAGSESAAGSRIQIRGGEALKIEKIGADMGTTVTVSDLFFNIPARLKHLNAPRSEGAKIVDYLSRMAISYPNIAFRLISNGTVLFATRGAGDRLAAITTVYGTGVAAFLIGVTGVDSDLGMSLEGYIAGPNGLRKSRKGQVLFVNGRSVKNPAIDAAIDRAYKEFAEPGRFPFTFLFLKVNPADVDVNVHPAKNEIAFADAAMAGEFVEKTIRAALVSERSVPTLSLRGRGRRRAGADDTFRLQPDANPQTAPSAVS
ncbi:MAG: DNA mismatch repair endonuclease MutL, partial [Clostridiales Family XIII bacterium]|nr:DNA mismatch repair endonuclease MutL [Clostridiales Family XIII bacterium]